MESCPLLHFSYQDRQDSRSSRLTRNHRWLPGAWCLGFVIFSAPSWVLATNTTELEPLVVTATRTEKSLNDTPIRTEIVSQKELERTHARTLKEALQDVPGLQLNEIHGRSGYSVSMQGMTSDQVLVLIDGLPITSSTNSTMDLSQYELANVDHIEIVKGASSAQYGSQAMGGVINVITRAIQPGFSGVASASGGSYGNQNVSGHVAGLGRNHIQLRAEGGTEKLRLRVSGERLDDRGFTQDRDSFARPGDAIRRKQYTVRAGWHPSADGTVWTEAAQYVEDSDSRFRYFVPPSYLPQTKTEADTRNRFSGGSRWQWQNGLSASLSVLNEHYKSRSDELSTGTLVDRRDARQETNHVSGQLDLPYWAGQLWQLGFDWHHETLEQTSNGTSELQGTGQVRRSSRELFAQNDVLFNERWELLLGARLQDDSDFGVHAVPKLALRVQLLDTGGWNAALRASFGQGYRVPNLKERHFLFDHSSLGYKVIGNPQLQPEQSNSWQLGTTLSWHNTVQAGINFFRNDVKDLIQTDIDNAQVINDISYFTYKNVDRAMTQGLETTLRWQATQQLSFTGAYTYTQTKDRATGDELTMQPKHTANLGVDWEWPTATTLSLRGRYQSSELSASESGTSDGTRSPGWTTLNVTLNQEVGHGFSTYLGINNLTNQQRDFSAMGDFGPVTGRFVYLGLRYAWDSSPQ